MAVTAHNAPNAVPYLNTDTTPCRGIAWAFSIIASRGASSRMRRTSVSTSTEPPTVGMSSARIVPSGYRAAIAPVIPGSTPRIGEEPLSASGSVTASSFAAASNTAFRLFKQAEVVLVDGEGFVALAAARTHETDALASIVDVVHRRRRERCRGHDCVAPSVSTHTSPLMAVSNFFRDTTQRPPTRRAGRWPLSNR